MTTEMKKVTYEARVALSAALTPIEFAVERFVGRPDDAPITLTLGQLRRLIEASEDVL